MPSLDSLPVLDEGERCAIDFGGEAGTFGEFGFGVGWWVDVDLIIDKPRAGKSFAVKASQSGTAIKCSQSMASICTQMVIDAFPEVPSSSEDEDVFGSGSGNGSGARKRSSSSGLLGLPLPSRIRDPAARKSQSPARDSKFREMM